MENQTEAQETSQEPVDAGEQTQTEEQTEQTQPQESEYEKKIRDLEEKNRQLFERTKKAEAIAKERKQAPENQDKLNEIEEKVNLRLEGYSAEEIASMEAFARGQSKRLSEVKDDPFVKKAVEGLRAEQKSKDATPTPSSRTFTREKKTWATMSADERKANFNSFVGHLKGKNRSRNE